ncbi:disease resistance protein TAO1-like [Carya illinoinensis]|uniref:disease resistance protein TAO1-like n=1 Tax=Carya illinoinensis TaxID=32201 RepID=UPI001C726DEE|nr:disease resistance protein TAO1-like [Carya illinoinensis]XP_042963327.1 disease resistance protein TAO1-like [Carya illinoinensis]
MKRLRVLINRNASFSSGPNYLCNELRVLDWFEYPLQSLPPDFHGNKLIIFKIRGAFIRELSFIREFKNMTIMEFHDCNCLTKLPDVSSIPNLKNLKAINCENLVEVHNSVGSLKNLCHLSFFGCSKLRILPTSLKLRSLRTLNLSGCLSLRSFPEIDCEMKSLTTLALPYWSAVEELPLSIGNLTRFDESFLRGCKNLKHLPINIILRLQHLRRLGGCTNLPMEEKISSNEGQLQELARPTNSSNGSSVLQVLNRQNCFQSESNFFPISSFFTMFNSSATLTNLDRSTFVSLPTSIKGFVALIELYLKDCKKLEEIAELPPNIANVFVEGCQSLERFPEVSRILEFNGSHIRSLGFIGLEGCNKMHEKIWNYKVPNPLLWKGHYNATVLPENEIPECLWYQKEFLGNKIAKRGDDDVQLKGNEEWVINIEGPHHLEDISGIVIYVLSILFLMLR